MTPDSSALWRALDLLRCPLCGDPVEPVWSGPASTQTRTQDSAQDSAQASTEPDHPPAEGRSGTGEQPAEISGVRCRSGHSFDRARQGHLTLFGPRGRRFAGDSTDQVLAREKVLASGVLDPVADLLGVCVREALSRGEDTNSDNHDPTRAGTGPVVLEAGAGTGFYLASVLHAIGTDRGTDRGTEDPAPPLGIGTEISVAAARRLARADTDIAAIVADTWDQLPFADDSVDVVQVVFAPRNAAEFARVLAPGGSLVVAGPGPGHLEPLRTDAGMLTPDADRPDRLEAALADHFIPGSVRVVDTIVRVPGQIAVDLALMGPSGVHLERAEVEKRLGDADRDVRVHVELRTFHSRDDARDG